MFTASVYRVAVSGIDEQSDPVVGHPRKWAGASTLMVVQLTA